MSTDGDSTAGQGALRRWLGSTRRGMTLPLVIAVVGMVTGVTSLYITWRSTSEQSALRLAAYPTTSPSDITPQGLGVRAEIVNESLRPVVLRSAELVLDGTVVSAAHGWIGSVGLLEGAASDPTSLTTSQRSFPLGVGAREGRSVVLMLDLWSPFVDASSDVERREARATFRELAAALASLPLEGGESRLELQLDHVPGGVGRYPVLASSTPRSSVGAIESAAALLSKVPPQLWVTGQLSAGDTLNGITLRRRFAGADEIDHVRLDLWNVRTEFHRTDVRPVVARQQTVFPLAGLPTGSYVATFTVDSEIVAYTSFRVPIRPRS